MTDPGRHSVTSKRAQPKAIGTVAGRAHDRHDLLDGWRVSAGYGRLCPKVATVVIARHRGR